MSPFKLQLNPSIIFVLSSLFILPSAWSASKITIEGAYVTAVPSVSQNTAGYFILKNPTDTALRLVKASSSAAATLEFHNHVHRDGMMKMEQVESVEIPVKGSVELKPMGLHLMFIGLKKDFSKKQSVPVKLEFSDGSSLKAEFPVKGASTEHHHH